MTDSDARRRTVLVIGAAGMLGRPVAERLLTEAHLVPVLARDAGRARQALGPRVECLEGDVGDTKSMEGCGAVQVAGSAS